MTYRLVYKRFSTISKNLELVEEDIEATSFHIEDGNLTFTLNGHPVKAVPMTMWLSVDPAPETPSRVAL